jgi:uncharacterized protein DUF2344
MPPAGEVPTGREYIGRWENALLDSGLPVLLLGTGRPRIALGAPLPSGSSAERELVEFWLTRTLPAWAIREPLSSHLPTSHRAVDLENVWIGAPALSGQVAAADYSVSVSGDVSLGAADAAAARLLERNHVPRKRQKGGRTTCAPCWSASWSTALPMASSGYGCGPGSTPSVARADRTRSSPRSATSSGRSSGSARQSGSGCCSRTRSTRRSIDGPFD